MEKLLRRVLRRPRKSARALIIDDGKLLVFRRKRYVPTSGEWLEYFSIPGGGIDRGETAEQAVIRELKEEMGVDIALGELVAHKISDNFEHFVYTAKIVAGTPALQSDSEEALHMSEYNQFIVEWVPITGLLREHLSYYGDYLQLVQELMDGRLPSRPLEFR